MPTYKGGDLMDDDPMTGETKKRPAPTPEDDDPMTGLTEGRPNKMMKVDGRSRRNRKTRKGKKSNKRKTYRK